MSRLFRILRAAEKEVDLIKIGTVLSRTGEEIGLRDLAPITRNSENILHIGDQTAASLVDSLRSGRVEEAISHIYRIENVPEAVKLKFLDEVKDLPSAHVGLAEEKADLIKNSFKEKLSTDEYIKLDAPDATPLTIEDVNKSTALSKVVDLLKNTKVISIYTGVILFGGTTALVLASINNHRRELRGCYKFTNINGTIHSCKVIESSCVDGQVDLHQTTRACLPTPTSRAESSVETCASVKGVGCINCPPKHLAKPTSTNENIDKPETMANEDDFDKVFYRCNNPSNMDAFADLLNEKAGNISNVLGNIGGVAAKTIDALFTGLRYVFIIMGLVAGILVIAYGINRYSIISNDGIKNKKR